MLDLRSLARPTDPDEAVRLFAESDGAGLYVAGGTVVVGAGSPNLDFLVDLTHAGLEYVRRQEAAPGGYLAIGSMVRIADLVRSAEAAGLGDGVLCEAARSVANHTIRNRATVGGNVLSWAFPSDLPPALLALDASVVVRSAAGEREIDLDEFYRSRREAFRKGDLVVEARVPLEASRLRGAFAKSGRKRLDVAIANCAVALLIADGVIGDARIALNGVDSVPLRAREAERSLITRSISDTDFHEAARLAADSLEPRSDHRASAGYRKKLAAVLVRRALVRAACRMGE
jgi:CO/xanthine dehydrogenase FAD-binding subunit